MVELLLDDDTAFLRPFTLTLWSHSYCRNLFNKTNLISFT